MFYIDITTLNVSLRVKLYKIHSKKQQKMFAIFVKNSIIIKADRLKVD